MPTIRPAKVTDVSGIAEIINGYAEYGIMLHRSLTSLYENVRDYFVAVEDDGRVVGVCGLAVVWADLAEVYALAVASDQRGKRIGPKLVEHCVEEAARLGVRRLMTLTYEQRFFEQLKFEVVDRQKLPLKVWSECLRCPKNQACDEIAMIRVLDDVPQVDAPRPTAPPPSRYVMPVVMSVSAGKKVLTSDDQAED